MPNSTCGHTLCMIGLCCVLENPMNPHFVQGGGANWTPHGFVYKQTTQPPVLLSNTTSRPATTIVWVVDLTTSQWLRNCDVTTYASHSRQCFSQAQILTSSRPECKLNLINAFCCICFAFVS